MIKKLKETLLRDYDIFLRMTAALAIGMAAYGLATRHMVLWIAVSAVIPAILLLINFTYKKIFINLLYERKIALIKCITFILQNLAIIYAYYFLEESSFSLVCLWIFRLNVFEVFLDLVTHKEFALCLPTIFLFFSPLEFVKDPQFIIWMNGGGVFFVIDYALWFMAWIAVRFQDRYIISIHTLYPIFFPPQLWYSIRTLTGMVTLIYAYIRPISTHIVESGSSKESVVMFGKIYKQIYLFIWPALCLYRFYYQA